MTIPVMTILLPLQKKNKMEQLKKYCLLIKKNTLQKWHGVLRVRIAMLCPDSAETHLFHHGLTDTYTF